MALPFFIVLRTDLSTNILPSIPTTPSINSAAPFRTAVMGINFLPAVKVNKYNTVPHLWSASIMADALGTRGIWCAIPFSSIPAKMQSFFLVNIRTHDCLLFLAVNKKETNQQVGSS